MAYAEVITALADPTRRQVLEALVDEPKPVGVIAKSLPVSRPAVSQHLKVLESAKLVYARPDGNRRLYVITHEGFNELREYLERFWTQTLSAYKTEIEKRVSKKAMNKRGK